MVSRQANHEVLQFEFLIKDKFKRMKQLHQNAWENHETSLQQWKSNGESPGKMDHPVRMLWKCSTDFVDERTSLRPESQQRVS